MDTKKKTIISFKSKAHEELEDLIKKLKMQRIIYGVKFWINNLWRRSNG